MAAALGLSKQRIYQLDAELTPVIVKRGEKMVARWYRPEVVEAFKARRAARVASASGGAPAEATAKAIAARVLEEYAKAAPFFKGVRAEDTSAVREALRGIAARLT